MKRENVQKAIVGHIPDALMVLGGGSIAWGAGMVFLPAGFIVGGVLAAVAGWMAARGAN
jgi:hypothetical protein